MEASSKREELISKVQSGTLTPEQADLEAERQGIAPLIFNPDPNDFDPMRQAHWSMPMAVAWIAYRTPEAVREWWDPYRTECRDWHFRETRARVPGHSGYFIKQREKASLAMLKLSETVDVCLNEDASAVMTVTAAVNGLRVELEIGHLSATGIDAATGEYARISAYLWKDLEFVEIDARDVARSRPEIGRRQIRFEHVTVPRDAITQIWRPLPEQPEPVMPPLIAPEGSGYMPFFCAVQWVATEGGAIEIDPKDVRIWERSYRTVLDKVASGQVRISGVRDGLRQPIDGIIFADCMIDYPYQNTTLEMSLSEEFILLSHDYVDEKTWRSGFDDRIENRWGKLWIRLMVDKVDVAREWSYGTEDNELDVALLPTGAPGRPTVMHLVKAEFERRRDAGRLEASLTAQAEELVEWLRTKHPRARALKPKTIANNLRAAFRAAANARN